MDYLSLFASAFLAATILPFYSEVVLLALISKGSNIMLLVIIATVGNTLGAMVNWWLGLYIQRFKHKRWFYFKEKQIERAQAWFNRYGRWSLLMAWLPIGGDALTLIAGIMRVPLSVFVLLVAIGKGLRYMALALVPGYF